MIKEGFRTDIINVGVITVNGQSISIYKKHIMKVAVTDINNVIKSYNVMFIVINVRRYKIILDYL